MIKFEDVFNLETLLESERQCKSGTIWKNSMLEFDLYKQYAIRYILDSLYDNSFEFDPLYHTVIYERGKERLICSLTVKDRVVQKTMNQLWILPTFRPRLVYDNCASLKDRGIDFAINRLKCHMQKAYGNYGRNFYIAKIDIKSYFDSISHNYILDQFCRYTEDPRLINLFAKILYQFRIDLYINNGLDTPIGIGLGGEVPQSIGIICLNELDHLIKEYYRIPYMVRYMDDIIMIHNDKYYLTKVVYGLSEYLNSIGLRFNENKTCILPASDGVKFLKFHFYLGNNNREIYIKPSKKSIKNEIRKIKSLSEKYYNLEILHWQDVLQSYNSYIGHIARADSYNEINKLEQLIEFYYPDDDEMTNHIMSYIEKNNP